MTDRTKCLVSVPDRNPSRKRLVKSARTTGVLLAFSALLSLSACGSGGGADGLSAASAALVTEKVTVAWGPPVANEDGSALTDLAGYRLYYGSKPSSYEHVVDVKDPKASIAELPLPSKGTWYISARSYRINGLESSLAEEIVYENVVL